MEDIVDLCLLCKWAPSLVVVQFRNAIETNARDGAMLAEAAGTGNIKIWEVVVQVIEEARQDLLKQVLMQARTCNTCIQRNALSLGCNLAWRGNWRYVGTYSTVSVFLF